MTREQIEDSLALWEERVERFRKNWQSKKRYDPRRAYWYRKLKKAKANVSLRRNQLAKYKVTGVSSRGVRLVAEFEGFRSAPYLDPVGIWTIGYGETQGIGPNTSRWSEAYAFSRLRKRLNRDFFPAVRRLSVFDKLNQNQVDALTSFVYNLGPGTLAPGTSIGNALRSKNWKSATADAILLYDKAGGRRLEGLTRRRKAERQLFLS